MMGDNHYNRASGADRESSGIGAGMGDRQDPQPMNVRPRGLRAEPYSEEGGPQAERPRHRQISCETCCLSFEPYQRRVQCSGCSLWTHEECIEQLDFGTKWHAEMCLSCHQRATRMFRVVSAIELRRGHHWNQDEWFDDLLNHLVNGTGYGETRNKDLNKLELFMAKAVMNGLS